MITESDIREIKQYTSPEPFTGISQKTREWEEQLTGGDSYFIDWVRDAILLYELVRTEIEFVDTGRKLHYPPETYQKQRGDCVDQCFLLTALYTASESIEHIRITSINNPDNELHAVLQVGILDDHQTNLVLDDFHEAYQVMYGVEIDKLMTYRDKKNEVDYLWLIADPTSGRYLSCPEELEIAGFIRNTESSWEWTDPKVSLDIPRH